MSELQFKGYAIHDTNKWNDFKLIDFTPKQFADYDVDIKVHYCGICGSDIHTALSVLSLAAATPLVKRDDTYIDDATVLNYDPSLDVWMRVWMVAPIRDDDARLAGARQRSRRTHCSDVDIMRTYVDTVFTAPER